MQDASHKYMGGGGGQGTRKEIRPGGGGGGGGGARVALLKGEGPPLGPPLGVDPLDKCGYGSKTNKLSM